MNCKLTKLSSVRWGPSRAFASCPEAGCTSTFRCRISSCRPRPFLGSASSPSRPLSIEKRPLESTQQH